MYARKQPHGMQYRLKIEIADLDKKNTAFAILHK